MDLFLPVLDLHQTVQYFPAPTSEPSAGLSAPDFLQKKYASFCHLNRKAQNIIVIMKL